MVSLHQLEQSSLAELEAIYAERDPVRSPTGRFRGVHLLRLDRPGARRPWYVGSVGFGHVSFGIDFDQRRWFFVHPELQVGRFVTHVGPSRWRDATVVQLHYGVSRAPRFVRQVLYDEVKPLSDELCLGMGGIALDRGKGDHFFFALERLA